MVDKDEVVDLTSDFYDEIKKLEDELLKIPDRVVSDGVSFSNMARAMACLLRTMGEILVSSRTLKGSLDEVLDRVLFDYACFYEYAKHINEMVYKYAGDDEHYQNILEITSELRKKATKLAIAIIKHHFIRLK